MIIFFGKEKYSIHLFLLIISTQNGSNNKNVILKFLVEIIINYSLYFISKGIRYSLINKSNNKNDKRANFSF